MRIAIPYDNGNVNIAFGRTQYFKLYDVEDGKIISSQVIDNGGYEHKGFITHLKNNKVNVALVGDIGQHGFDAFSENGIKLYTSVSGETDHVVRSYLNEALKLKKEIKGCHHAE